MNIEQKYYFLIFKRNITLVIYFYEKRRFFISLSLNKSSEDLFALFILHLNCNFSIIQTPIPTASPESCIEIQWACSHKEFISSPSPMSEKNPGDKRQQWVSKDSFWTESRAKYESCTGTGPEAHFSRFIISFSFGNIPS